MCGLVGIFGSNMGPKDHEAFALLHLLDVTRGDDGCGVYLHNAKTDGGTLLKTGNSFPFFEDENQTYFTKRGNFKDPGKYDLLMGHNRKATKGSVSEPNSHPFEFSTLVGAHNGGLEKQYTKVLPNTDKFEVDSQALYWTMNEVSNGTHEKFKTHGDIFKELDGAFALTWWDKQTNTFHIYRNHQRPFTYCFSADYTKMYYASEEWMLMLSLIRAKVDVAPKSVVELTPRKHLAFKINEEGIVEEVTSEVWNRFHSTGGTTYYGGNYGYKWPDKNKATQTNNHGKGQATAQTKKETKQIEAPKKEVKKTPENFFYDVFNYVWDLDELEEKLKYGCANCGGEIEASKEGIVGISWFDEDSPCCATCMGEQGTHTALSMYTMTNGKVLDYAN